MNNRYSISERLSGLRNAEGEQQAPSSGRQVEAATPPETARTGHSGPTRTDLHALKARIQKRLISDLNPSVDLRGPQVRQIIEQLFNDILLEESVPLPRLERQRLFDAVVAELLAYGPIEPLLHDDTVTEIMVNGPDQVWIERGGRLVETEIKFESDEHVRRIIDRIIAPLGRRCDDASPMVDARLPDGSRVNAIIPPLSLVGPVLTIRKFSREPFTVKHLIEFGTLTQEVADFLGACVKGELNIIVSGGTGSGKTTFLNILSGYIPADQRIVTIEDAAELQLRQRHVVTLEKRPPNVEGAGEIAIRQLLINALRMRPDRIVVGEVRGPEALDMLQAMNTGHDGSMTTLHSNSPRDTLARMETLVLMAGVDLPHRAIREQIASAIHLIVHQERMWDGSRKIVKVAEVQGMEGDVIVLQDLFSFQQAGVDGRKILGRLEPVGIRPKFLPKLELHGVRLPATLFGGPRRMAS
jgi:pilus assembly protein CpaF